MPLKHLIHSTFIDYQFKNFICGTFNSTETAYTDDETPFVVLSKALKLLLSMEKFNRGTFNSAETAYTDDETPFMILSKALKLLLLMAKLHR